MKTITFYTNDPKLKVDSNRIDISVEIIYKRDMKTSGNGRPSNEHYKTRALEQGLSFAKALLTGTKVIDKVRLQREEICARCPYMKENNRCGICGCKVRKFWKTMNLAAYEENLPEWGCKHPRRLQDGSGWPILNEQTRKALEEREELRTKRVEVKKQMSQGAQIIGGRKRGK